MKITPKMNHIEGSFDTETVKMVCVSSWKHGSVDLCLQTDGFLSNIQVGSIVLHDSNLYADSLRVFEDATKLGEEISRRWNECETKL